MFRWSVEEIFTDEFGGESMEHKERSGEVNKKRALKVLEMFLDKQCSLERTLNHMDTTDVEIWDAVYTATKALSAIEDIKAEINEFIKNPGFGDLDIGASCGAVRCLEIIDRHISGKESND